MDPMKLDTSRSIRNVKLGLRMLEDRRVQFQKILDALLELEKMHSTLPPAGWEAPAQSNGPQRAAALRAGALQAAALKAAAPRGNANLMRVEKVAVPGKRGPRANSVMANPGELKKVALEALTKLGPTGTADVVKYMKGHMPPSLFGKGLNDEALRERAYGILWRMANAREIKRRGAGKDVIWELRK